MFLFNKLTHEQNDRHFADGIRQWFFLNINIQNVFCLNILEVCSYGCNWEWISNGSEIACHRAGDKSLPEPVMPSNRPISQIPQCIRLISHNAPFCNRNVHTCAHCCNRIVHCGIWNWCIVGSVREVYWHIYSSSGFMVSMHNLYPRCMYT